mgnify:CR=1 FL=1
MIHIKHCVTNADFVCGKQIMQDYLRWLNIDLSFQNIEQELANFSIVYGAPFGLFLLAYYQTQLVGGVGLRPIDAQVCEMKRLFVYEQFKHQGIGKNLCLALIAEAKRLGYKKMRLDTLGWMDAAIQLYKTLGFYEIDAYRFNPDPTTVYLELILS